MDIEKAKKVFPKFFENFGYKIPEGAKEENEFKDYIEELKVKERHSNYIPPFEIGLE